MTKLFGDIAAYLKAVFIESQRWVFTAFDVLGLILFFSPHLAENLINNTVLARGIGGAVIVCSLLLANFTLYERVEGARDKQLGRSCSLNILHVAKWGHKMESPDNPWEPFELQHVIIDIAFFNTSERPVFLKALHAGLALKNRGIQILGSRILTEEIFRAGVSLPFRYMDYTRSEFTISLGKPITILRIPYAKVKGKLEGRFITSEFFINMDAEIAVIDKDTEQPVSRQDWIEISPGDRKVWSIQLPIEALGAYLVRQRQWTWSAADVLLEFDTCSVKARAKIPDEYYYWTDSESYSLLRPS